jgi:hypothetical protein
MVLPTEKKSLGLFELDNKKKFPELSETVGCCQVTSLPVAPKGTRSKAMLSGHVTTGGMLSTVS